MSAMFPSPNKIILNVHLVCKSCAFSIKRIGVGLQETSEHMHSFGNTCFIECSNFQVAKKK